MVFNLKSKIKSQFGSMIIFALATFYFIFNFVNPKSFYMRLPDIKGDYSDDSHLKLEHIKKLCANADNICESDSYNVCALRMVNGKTQYEDFRNSCYLFLNNMCKHPGQEFSIVTSGTCEDYLKTRRNSISDVPVKNVSTLNGTSSQKPALRSSATMSTLYDVDSAFDYHVCPLSCPDTYAPVCVSVNRGYGRYFKFFTFVNHCSGDLYYCKHWQEFSPPPNEDENVVSSNLGWSFCGSSRYSHIMEPHESMNGFG